eukprot:scaffold122498_cov59-Phaeocystis_antarctica.AAC.1
MCRTDTLLLRATKWLANCDTKLHGSPIPALPDASCSLQGLCTPTYSVFSSSIGSDSTLMWVRTGLATSRTFRGCNNNSCTDTLLLRATKLHSHFSLLRTRMSVQQPLPKIPPSSTHRPPSTRAH